MIVYDNIKFRVGLKNKIKYIFNIQINILIKTLRYPKATSDPVKQYLISKLVLKGHDTCMWSFTKQVQNKKNLKFIGL